MITQPFQHWYSRHSRALSHFGGRYSRYPNAAQLFVGVFKTGVTFAEGLGAATASAMWAFVCAAVVAGLATCTDSGWYGRTTSPIVNIM